MQNGICQQSVYRFRWHVDSGELGGMSISGDLSRTAVTAPGASRCRQTAGFEQGSDADHCRFAHGAFGRNVLYWAERMLEEGYVHLIASEAHGIAQRPQIWPRDASVPAKRLVGKEL
jgi:hypothetical protein